MAFINCSQSALAESIGRDQHYISRRASGKVPFDTEDLAVIARALGTTVADFTGEDEPAEASA